MIELKNWHKGIIVGLGCGILFYLFQLSLVFYKDMLFSSFDKKAGLMYFYSLLGIENMILVLVLLVVLCGVLGFVLDFRTMHHEIPHGIFKR